MVPNSVRVRAGAIMCVVFKSVSLYERVLKR